MMTRERYEAEVQALNVGPLSRRYFFETADRMRVIVPLQDFEEVYVLRIVGLNEFPREQPVVTPGRMLYGYDGAALDTPSRANHVLGKFSNETAMCLFNDWSPRCSLCKLISKAQTWLLAYHLSLRSREPIDHFLSHE